MARVRSPNRDKAYEIYKEHNGEITNREIAKILNEDEKKIAVWKQRDKWNSNVVQHKNKSSTTDKKSTKNNGNKCSKKADVNNISQISNSNTKNKSQARYGNKNAVGHGAPKGNKNGETHGFYAKYLPEDTFEMIKEIETRHPLDILWDNIVIQYAAIIRAQKIMYVKSKEEMIKELKKEEKSVFEGGSTEKTEWEFQFAWDRQATFLNAQSRAMGELRSLIKQYDEMLHNNWDMATEEQKLRISKLKGEVDKLNGDKNDEPIKIQFIKASDRNDK
ncbi:phage terminase small subunit [Clostridium sp. UBA3061]|uniref:phage terminase small subunit n=1 Tax=Clostridium sp. UBA3061 TaxID=1946353 RepID=UPI0032168E1B